LGFVIASQVGGAGERYPPPDFSGKAASGTKRNTAPASNDVTPINSAAPPSAKSTAAPLNSGTADSAASSPYAPRTLGSANQPQMNAASPPAGAGQFQSPPPNSQSQPNFLSDPPATSAQPANGLTPTSMMRAMLSPPAGSQLRGDKVQLLEVISTGRSRNEQTQRVEAYWDMCSSVADYYLGLRELDEFKKLGTYVSRPGPAWQQAEKELGVRIDTSLHAARAAQFRLAGFIGRGVNSLPLPGDIPHCGSYTTQYDKIFSGRSAPEAQELANLLSRRYAELADAATGVSRAEQWLDGSVQSGAPDGVGGIQALELLALRRRAFVQIARDYNRRIARYTELATPGQIGADRLTSMLIKRSPSSTATRGSAPVPGPNWQSSNSAAPPRTFAEGAPPTGFVPIGSIDNREAGVQPNSGGRDRGVQPAAATQSERPTSEKSLLVTPVQ
jgi:hypothetical protein